MKNKSIDYSHPVLEVKDLRQHFRVGFGSNKMVIKAVDGISFNIYKREVFGLVGESGCGKTTTGRSIIKIYNPTDGIIKYNGRIVGVGLQGHRYRIRKAKEKLKAEIIEHKPLAKAINKIKKDYDKKLIDLNNEIHLSKNRAENEKAKLEDIINSHNEQKAIINHRFESQISDLRRDKKQRLDAVKKNNIRNLFRIHNKTISLIEQKLHDQIKFIRTIPMSEEEIIEKQNEVEASYHENKKLANERLLSRLKSMDEDAYHRYKDQVFEGKPLKYREKVNLKDENIVAEINEIENYFSDKINKLNNKCAEKIAVLETKAPNNEEIRTKIKEINVNLKGTIREIKVRIRENKRLQRQEIRKIKLHAKENPELYVENKEAIYNIKERYDKIIKDEKGLLKEHRYYNKLKETPTEKAERKQRLRELKAEFLEKISDLSIEEIEHERMVYNAEVKKINDNIPCYKNTMSSMQMVFQDPIASLNPRMIISDIISEGLIIRGERDKKLIKEKVNKILQIVGLSPDHATRYPHEFSGGQRQRIGIARALIVEPDFIIADEPISALDVSIQAQIINLLNDLKDELGLTILFIAHDLSVVKYFCDRIAVMYYGKIVEMASSEELFANPIHPYTKSLLSAIPHPDPHYEEKRKRKIYNPAIHNYLHDKPSLVEIRPNHFVYANNEEITQYKTELGLK